MYVNKKRCSAYGSRRNSRCRNMYRTIKAPTMQQRTSRKNKKAENKKNTGKAKQIIILIKKTEHHVNNKKLYSKT